MVDDKEVLDRLDRYAKAIARNLLCKFDLGQDRHRAEDIAQNLFLAGWQVWKAKGNEAFAKNRMSDRAKDEAEKLAVELRQPQAQSSLPRPASADRDDVDATEAFHSVAEVPYRRVSVEGVSRASPVEDMIVQEYLAGLTERQRRIVECRMAQMTVKEISQTLGVSTSTIERELTLLQKGLQRDQGD